MKKISNAEALLLCLNCYLVSSKPLESSKLPNLIKAVIAIVLMVTRKKNLMLLLLSTKRKSRLQRLNLLNLKLVNRLLFLMKELPCGILIYV